MSRDVSQTDSGEGLARRFHEAYERLAPVYGYATRHETREFDPESPNGKLMVAVCREILADAVRLRSALAAKSSALSRIDFMLGSSNDMECSLYDVDDDEERVVRSVANAMSKIRKYETIIDDACAVLRAPGTDNDGGPADIAEEIRCLLHNANQAAAEAAEAVEKLARHNGDDDART